MINFQKVTESRWKNNQEPRLKTTDLDANMFQEKVVTKFY